MKFINILSLFIILECGICYCQNPIKINDKQEIETDWLDAFLGGAYWEYMFKGTNPHFVIGPYPYKRGETTPYKTPKTKFNPLPNVIVLGTYHKDFDKEIFFQDLLPIWKANPFSNITGCVETISEDSTRVWYKLLPISVVSDEAHVRVTSIRLAFGGLFWDSMFEIKGCEFSLSADGRIANMILPPNTNTEDNRVIPNNALLLNTYNKRTDNHLFIEQLAAIWQFNKGKFIKGFVEQIDEQNAKVLYLTSDTPMKTQ